MDTVTLSIRGMSCGHCVASVRRALEAVPGVEVEQVRIGAAELRVPSAESADATRAAIDAIDEAGYEAAVAEPGAAAAATAAPAAAPHLTPLGRRHAD